MRSPSHLHALCRPRRPVLLGCGIVVGGLVGVLYYAASLLPEGFLETNTGFAAKVTASAVFVSKRSLDSVYEQELAADGLLERTFRLFLSIKVDHQDQTATASALGVTRTALFREGFGCTRVIDRTVDELRTEVSDVGETRPQSRPQSRRRPWATMGEDDEKRFDRDLLEATIEADDPRSAITLNQMLRMTSGLKWNEESSDHVSDMTRMLFRESSMAGFAAQAPVAAAPGKELVYSSGTTNLICEALRNSFKEDREYWEFPRRELFDPIGMSSAVFELDESGTLVGSSFCFATARDWARFGQLYLDDGVVDGRRILPEGWVVGASQGTKISKRRYGRHFWLPHDKSLPAGTFYCRGFEGQLIAIVPEKRGVIVRLGSTRDRKAWDPDRFVASIIKALR